MKTICIRTVVQRYNAMLDEKTWIRYMRWIAESAFSSIKKMFGEYASSIKCNNIVNELMLKASIYNMFIDKTMI